MDENDRYLDARAGSGAREGVTAIVASPPAGAISVAPPPREEPAAASGATRLSLARRPFHEVFDEVRSRADLHYKDQLLPLSRLSAEGEGIRVPGVGLLELTDWSRAQLARMLGVRRNRWFSDCVSLKERAEEINRRLARADGTWRIRARRYARGETARADGILRGIVSSTYEPLDDRQAFVHLARAVGVRTSRISFARAEVTDRASYYVAILEEERNIARPGLLDIHFPGFILVNSEVGFRALEMMEHWWRLVCTNGLVVRCPRSERTPLLYRMHRRTKPGVLDSAVGYAFAALSCRMEETAATLREAREVTIAEPKEALTRLLTGERELAALLPAVLEAYDAEPEPTRFGIVQAMTRAARTMEPETRLLLELRAGSLVSGAPAGEGA